MITKPRLDELRQRLAARSSQTTTPQAVKPQVTKPKEPKPMNGGTRTTKNNTGLEDYTNIQLTRYLDYANTMQDAYRAILELQNRFHKYRESLGNVCLVELERLEAEYQKYHGNGTATYQPEPELEPEPEPEPKPEPEPLPPLSWDVIQAIEANECPYGPYVMEIWESNWDYTDRRPNNKHMDANQAKAKDWTDSHKEDGGTIAALSDKQAKFLMVLLKGYFFHKRYPSYQASAMAHANNTMAAPPPF